MPGKSDTLYRMVSSRTKVMIALVSLVTLLVGGTAGFMLIEGWDLTDSLYMALITLTTVGFSEVRPLSPTGRHFMIVFLMVGVATVGFSLSTVVNYLFEGQMLATVRRRRTERIMRRMKNHYVVCGAGDIGREVVHEFRRTGTPHVVVELDPDHSELATETETVFVTGDAAEESVLQEARIGDARGLIAVLPSDAANVFVTLTARQLNPDLMIVAKATDHQATDKLRRAGATRVITPSEIAGRRIASSVLRPTVVNFLDVIVDDSTMSMRMEEFIITERSPLANQTLREANLGQHTGAIVLTITDSRGNARTDPSQQVVVANTTIHAGDRLIALGSEHQLRQLEGFVSP